MVRYGGTVQGYGGPVRVCGGTVVWWNGGTVVRFMVVRYHGGTVYGGTVWWCGGLEVGHGGLVRQRSNVSLGACQAGVGTVVGFGRGDWITATLLQQYYL